VIFAEGAPGDAMFLIESGRVRLSRGAGTPNEVEIATIGEREIFGEMALIDGSARMATATSLGQTIVIALGQAEFSERLEGLPGPVRELIRFLIHYCRRTLPYEQRKKQASLAKQTPEDALARKSLESPQAHEAASLTDPVLRALLQVLLAYTRRRLPPA
jgi:CRP-like cAMP-binding protein